MAAKPFSKEQLNFFKFSTLVLDEFPKVLREIFVTMWDSKVSMKPGFIPWDDSITVRNLLLASEGGKTNIPTGKSIKEWDCTALFQATIYAKTFGAPSSKGSTLNDLYLKKVKPAAGYFHSLVQRSTGNQDETYALAIDKLRLLRNKLCHSPKPEIVKTDFDVYVQLVINALTAMKIDTSFVDVIGQMSEDDFPTEKVQKLEECRMKELQAISMFHENIERKLSSMEKQTEKIDNMEQILSSIDKRTENIEQMMKNGAEPSKNRKSLASLFKRKRRDKEKTKEGKKKENKPFYSPNDHSDGHVLGVQQKHSREETTSFLSLADICDSAEDLASSVFLESEGRKRPPFIRPKSNPIPEHSKERPFGISRSNSSPMFSRQKEGRKSFIFSRQYSSSISVHSEESRKSSSSNFSRQRSMSGHSEEKPFDRRKCSSYSSQIFSSQKMRNREAFDRRKSNSSPMFSRQKIRNIARKSLSFNFSRQISRSISGHSEENPFDRRKCSSYSSQRFFSQKMKNEEPFDRMKSNSSPMFSRRKMGNEEPFDRRISNSHSSPVFSGQKIGNKGSGDNYGFEVEPLQIPEQKQESSQSFSGRESPIFNKQNWNPIQEHSEEKSFNVRSRKSIASFFRRRRRDKGRHRLSGVKVLDLNAEIYRQLCCKLNSTDATDDWQTLAVCMGYLSDDIKKFAETKDPADKLLTSWDGRDVGNDVATLIDLAKGMKRRDVVDLLELHPGCPNEIFL